jgi:hypothetical protein
MTHPMLARSADYLKGYMDYWCGAPASRLTVDYQKGYFAGMDAKRVLDEQGICTDNGTYPELAGAAR